MMLIRANTLSRGHSGIRLLTLQLLVEMLNRGVHPVIPEKGSLGASGDLAPLAHMALPLIGEGLVEYRGEVMSSAQAFQQAGLQPVRLAAKKGLACRYHSYFCKCGRPREHGGDGGLKIT